MRQIHPGKEPRTAHLSRSAMRDLRSGRKLLRVGTHRIGQRVLRKDRMARWEIVGRGAPGESSDRSTGRKERNIIGRMESPKSGRFPPPRHFREGRRRRNPAGLQEYKQNYNRAPAER